MAKWGFGLSGARARSRYASDAAGPLARLAEAAARGLGREKLREGLLPEEEGPARRRAPGRSYPGTDTRKTEATTYSWLGRGALGDAD